MMTDRFFKLFKKTVQKTKLGLIGAFVLSGWQANAQIISLYSFSQSQGNYTSLSNPTNIAVATAASGTGFLDENVYTLDNVIPFQFPFNGTNFNSLKVHANGFISFGAPITNSTDPIGSGVAYTGVISPLAADLASIFNINNLSSTIDYSVIGTTPNREFVVQWSHFRPFSSAPTATSYHDWNFQARLHENGTIKYVYNLTSQGTPSATNAKVGLRGTASNDYINRTASGNATSNWNNSTAGTNSSAGIATNYNFLPSQGLTLNWTPPSPCATPTSQPTNFTLSNTGIIINGSFTPSSSAADRYLILRTLAGTTSNSPVNGTAYTTGNNTSLNSYVAYYGANTIFENNYNHGIRGNNQYTYTIYAVNSNCSNGPLYNVQNPLVSNITNCPIGVSGITTSNITTNSFNINWATSENGTANPINTIIEVATDSNFNNMVAGSPFTLSTTTLLQAVNGLLPNTQYYIRGKNVSAQCESSYSSTASVYTACVAASALNENFDSVTGTNNLPNCWSKILTSNNTSIPTISLTTTDHFSAPNNISFYGNGATTTDAATKIILVSPELNNINSRTHRLRFKARRTATDTKVQIVALTGNNASANVEVIQTLPLTTTYQEFIVYLDNYNGSANYLGIRRVDGGTYSYMYVDDVIWEPIPACPELSTLTVNSTTPMGANISWTNVNNQQPANGYEYIVTTSNTTPVDGSAFTTLATGNNSVDISSLTNGTYYFWIRKLCSSTVKSPWKSVSFATIQTAPAPWKEEFLTSNYPDGWTNGTSPQSYTLGTARGATGIGVSATNLYKNLHSSAATGTFSTIAVGPLNSADYTFSFDYKQSNYNSPYAPLADWGNFEVQISTDFGITWTTLETVNNEAGTGTYIKKIYSLASYQNQYVKVRINANRTAGDYDLSFDNFEIKSPGNANPFCLPVFQNNSDGNMITKVTFNTIDNTSPFTSGTTPSYENFSAISTDINQGNTYILSVKGPSSTFPSDVMAYIDFNNNGIFNDSGESFYVGQLASANPANANTITTNITIPSTAVLGNTKMRIVKNTNITSTSQNSISGPCATDLRSGQVEDYTVKIIAGNLSTTEHERWKGGIKIYPNPTTSIIKIDSKDKIKSFEMYNISGQLVKKGGKTEEISLENNASGVYIVKIILENNEVSISKVIKK
ncbi:GEVED domain-containing protein [Chryseobacterium aahli]|uniref:T9SS type A sorting domain-containing protein n=1 Tax=Chryseobacterium aahli TaxID=1278643 RepID=UPI001F61B33C|nr:T9SS type A sorting domain-containing protein [Chryseobacterium aahli]MCI3935644.1 GEVED domain-containing protein [Chryseobacterium aahli]